MNKLDKAAIAERDAVCASLREKYSTLETAVDEFNFVLEQAWDKVDSALTAYNEAVGEANSWREGIAGDMQTYFDERSEKWQEGDKGQEYASWKQQFEEELQDADLPKPEKLELQIDDAAEILEQLPETP